jgi:predicted DNA-binding protein
MKGITLKLPEETLRRLEQEARAAGRSVAAIIREHIEAPPKMENSIYSLTRDLAGSLSDGASPAANERRKFKRA